MEMKHPFLMVLTFLLLFMSSASSCNNEDDKTFSTSYSST
jgi:hypothetical protein